MDAFLWNGTTLPAISLIGRNECGALQQSPKRVLADFVFYLVTEGELFLSENGREILLSRGDCLFLEPHLLQFGSRPSRYHILYVHFSLPGLRRFSGDLLPTEAEAPLFLPKKISLGDSPAFFRLRRLLEEAAEQGSTSSPSLACTCRFLLFLTRLSREARERFSKKPRPSSPSTVTAERVLAYLHENYHRRLTGDLIAKELSYHFDYLNQLFRATFRTSVFRMLEQIRMENAENLLANSNCSVKEIAEETGYRDESYFSKVFKKRTGLTPLQFRKRTR